MLQKIKNFLKRFLPPPVNVFNREIERILAILTGQEKRWNAELKALGQGQETLKKQVQSAENSTQNGLSDVQAQQKQLAFSISVVEKIQKGITSNLIAGQEIQRQLVTTAGRIQENQCRAEKEIDDLQNIQKQTLSAVDAVQVSLDAKFSELQARLDQVEQENAALKKMLSEQERKIKEFFDQQKAHADMLQKQEVSEIQKQTKQSERAIIAKIDREKQELFYEYYSRLKPEQYERELELWYRKRTGKILNLKAPKTFNEKIQWMKLYDSMPLKTQLADKYLARDWVKEKIGEEYLIPLLGVWDSFDEINFDKLPNQFALKTNHGSGWNVIVKDKATFNKAEAKSKFDQWIRKNYAFVGLELHYKDIQPKIIAEQYIENAEGLIDYRFYCFNGKPVQVWVDIYSGMPQHMRSIFDMEWNPVPMKCTWPDGGELLSKEPENFQEMKTLAQKLSKDFSFIRVDFFEVDGKIYVGEMTFTPMNGSGVFEPSHWDRTLGDLLELPPKSQISM